MARFDGQTMELGLELKKLELELLRKTGIFMATCKGGASGGASGAFTPQIFN